MLHKPKVMEERHKRRNDERPASCTASESSFSFLFCYFLFGVGGGDAGEDGDSNLWMFQPVLNEVALQNASRREIDVLASRS